MYLNHRLQLSSLLSRLLSLTLAMGTGMALLTANPVTAAEAAAALAPVVPVPRNAEGRIYISRLPGERSGLWVPDYSRGNAPSFNTAEVQFKPWAKGLYDARQAHDLEPHARCKASGAVRQFLTPYGVEILEVPELQRLYIFDIGGPQTFREVYMDGRTHPVDLEPTNYGHNIGWWDGDTLVVDSVGYNSEFWFERAGLPHTEAAHVVEYFTRTSRDSLSYRFVLTDEFTYDSTVEANMRMRWGPEEELFEFVCQQSNYAAELMVTPDGTAHGSSNFIIP
jgi:hypothetical protein